MGLFRTIFFHDNYRYKLLKIFVILLKPLFVNRPTYINQKPSSVFCSATLLCPKSLSWLMLLLILLRSDLDRIDYASDEQLPVNRFGFLLIRAALNSHRIERVFMARILLHIISYSKMTVGSSLRSLSFVKQYCYNAGLAWYP